MSQRDMGTEGRKRMLPKRTLVTDVVIIGSGGSGSAAALTAAEGGAKVIVLEEKRFYGGISNMGMEVFAAESNLQRQNNVPYTKDDAFRIFMQRTKWRADPRLVRAFIDTTASTIEWLERQGVEFELAPFFLHPDSPICAHLVKTRSGDAGAPGAFATMLKILRGKAQEKGVEIRFSTRARKLIKGGNRITGVMAEDKSGTAMQLRAKAVIMASGGYLNNKEMLKRYGGFEIGSDLFLMEPMEQTGSGIQMAWEAGAAKGEMAVAVMSGVPEPKGVRMKTRSLSFVAFQPYLWVNQSGERFIDEGNFVTEYRANAIARQKNACAYCILDGSSKTYLEEKGLDCVPVLAPFTEQALDIDDIIKVVRASGQKNVFVANSLAELGNEIGISSDAFQKTVDEYNTFCDKGHDDLFAKNSRFLRPVRTPKFYAFKIRNMAYTTLGGLKINERTNVLDTEGEAIPGLYAAGDVANEPMSYDVALAHVLRGGPMSFALNTGRIAGKNALKYMGM
jgi:fumarate reductase flavoprotein subunit